MSEPRSSRPRGRRDDDLDTQISKTMSYILRHGATKEGLTMRSDGYIKVDDLLSRPKMTKLGCDFVKLREIVDTNTKKRYNLLFEPASANEPSESTSSDQLDGVWWIRANQGHTVDVEELELTEITDPAQVPMAVHGTKMAAWESIAKIGLSKMKRNHIHLAQGLAGSEGVISGMRTDSPILIFIDLPKAMEQGIQFHLSANGVLLTKGDKDGLVPPDMFETVIWRRKGVLNYWDGKSWVKESVNVRGEPVTSLTSL